MLTVNLRLSGDSPKVLIERCYNGQYLENHYNIDEMIDKIDKVSKADILQDLPFSVIAEIHAVKNDLAKTPTNGIEKADSSIFGKNVLHVQYQANKLGRYVVIGTRIAEHQHDLSKLDSVEVWIKGDGDFEIVLETIVESDTNYKTSYKESVNKEWTRVVVTPKDFTNADGKSYHGWDVTRNKITRFTIFVYNGSDVWIDNVKMYGINLDDLL